jgi:drug/metabolite transporter (DMT)-like permease
MSLPPTAKGDVSIYLLGSGLGICAGFVQVEIGDLLFTALCVLIFTLALGMLRPSGAWRWTLLVASFVPAMQLLAYVWLRQKPDRAQIYESFLVFLAGFAGAYGGAVAHRGWKELFGKGASGR